MADGRHLERNAGPPGDPHLGDAIVELVLGDVDSDRRAAMAAHLLRCPDCRREYDELAATVEELLPAVPGIQPPLGFDERVLARLAADAGSTRARSSRRWRWLAVAAAVLVAVLVPAGIWVAARDDEAPSTGEVATLRLTGDDAPVGTVSLAHVDNDHFMVVALVAAPDDIAYYCRIRLTDGSTVDSESWPAGNGAWVVPLPPGADVTGVDVLPSGTEHVWSTAEFT